MRRLLLAAVAVGLVAWMWLAPTPQGDGTEGRTVLTLYRFFGGCADEYAHVTEVSLAVGECGVMQVLTNKFNAEQGQAIVRTQAVDWAGYYDRLSAAYAARHPPDVAIMNRSVLPNFVARGLVRPLRQELEAAGVPLDDLLPIALQDVTFDGDLYALPFDLHGLLWHVNLDLFARAGLLAPTGDPKLPRSPQELLEQGRRMRETTGKLYLAMPSQTDPMPTWLFQSWLWQQGEELLGAQGPRLESPAADRALTLLARLYQGGYTATGHDYAAAEQAFLQGEAAVLVNGTWVVDSYRARFQQDRPGATGYGAYPIPTLFDVPGAWSDSHVWVLPEGAGGPRSREGAIAFLAYLFEHSEDWARTGHLPVRASVLGSRDFLALPGRRHYVGMAHIARSLPPVPDQRAIQDVLVQELNATWLVGRDVAQALHQAQDGIERILERHRRRAHARR